jgi:hypothetical protein
VSRFGSGHFPKLASEAFVPQSSWTTCLERINAALVNPLIHTRGLLIPTRRRGSDNNLVMVSLGWMKVYVKRSTSEMASMVSYSHALDTIKATLLYYLEG